MGASDHKEPFAQATIDTLSSHIAVLDREGTIVAVNQAWRDFAKAHAASPERVCEGANYLEVCDVAFGKSSDGAAAFAADLRAVLAGQRERCEREYPCHTPTEDLWFVGTISRFTRDGSTYIAVAHENITDRKLAIDALRESEDKYRSLVERANDGIGIIQDGTLTYANPRLLAMGGYTMDEFLGKKFSDFVHHQDLGKALSYYGQRIEGKDAPTGYELRLLHKSGATVYAEISGGLITYENRAADLIICRDVTERKEIEKALQQSEEAFRLSFESAVDPIFWADPETGLITRCNGAAEVLLEKGRDSIIGKHHTSLHRSDRADYYRDKFKRHIKEKGALQDEAEIVTGSGKIVPVEITASVTMVGDTPLIQGIFRNITERKKAEEALRRANEELGHRVAHRTAELARANEQLRDEIEQRKDAEVALLRTNRTLGVLSGCNEALIRASDAFAFMDEVCRIIVDDGGYCLAWVGLAQQDEAKTVRPAAQSGFEEGYLETVDISWADTEKGRGPTGTAIRTKKPCVVRDILTDANYAPWRKEAKKRGYRGSIALPLVENGRAFGALNIYACESGAFDKEEVGLLSDLAADLSYGITALRAKADLRMAEEGITLERKRFFSLLEELPAFVYLQAPDYTLRFANRYFRKAFGDPKGKRCYEVLRKRSRPCEECPTLRVFETKSPEEWEWFDHTRQRTYHVYDYPFTDVDGSPLVLELGIDVTARKQAEDALTRSEENLRRLSTRLLNVQEEERSRISRELHDSIGQALAAIKFGAENAFSQMDQGETAEGLQTLEALIPMAQRASEEVRKIHTDLRPSLLDDLGIVATMAWFCREFERLYGQIRIKKRIDIKEKDVPEPLKIVIFRVLQEALNNTAKYAHADEVTISLRNTGGCTELTIQDNGQGFEAVPVLFEKGPRAGIGLTSMKERTQLSGGAFLLESAPGMGTLVRASWPSLRGATGR
ncbi:MAG: PAS domain S-box protein [Thermodesulfobacteriota bacterium]|nr:PAS domain S-box protein [Thermodesulfobacteriota bacterium]